MAITLPIKLENIRPMSVHKSYDYNEPNQPKSRTRSYEYQTYEKKILRQLDEKNVQMILPESGELFLQVTFGTSSKFNTDNLIPPFLDVIARRFNFNASRITYLEAEKKVTDQGAEFISFQIGQRYVEGVYDRKEIRIFNKNNSDSDRI